METRTKPMTFSDLEKEVNALWIASDAIDSVVNHVLLELGGLEGEKEVRIPSSVHQKLFNILLLDFLEPVDEWITGISGSCVGLLEHVCRTASFDEQGSIEYLSGPVGALRTWLDGEMTVDAWLPSIDMDVCLTMKREISLRVCGNISKHNPSRLTRIAKDMQQILQKHGITATHQEVLGVLPEFYDRFGDGIFNYQSNAIAELLNNVRWGIHDYLELEYLRAHVRDPVDASKYRYKYPAGMSNEFVKGCYWALMNSVRRGPYVNRFAVNKIMKSRY